MDQMKASNATFLDESTGGKGKYFRARILQAGLVKYSFGVCLLEKETIDRFIYDFVGCPVIIDHKDVTEENAKEERVGVISRVWFNEADGWFWVEGVIFDEKAISLINDGYNVSCQYEISEYANNVTDALHNGNLYDKVILNGKPEHLAIVKNPRYENAMIAVNALDATNEQEFRTDPEDGHVYPIDDEDDGRDYDDGGHCELLNQTAAKILKGSPVRFERSKKDSYLYRAELTHSGQIYYEKIKKMLNKLAGEGNHRWFNGGIDVRMPKASNADDEKGRWITIKGTHVFIKDGQSVEDAMREHGFDDSSDKESGVDFKFKTSSEYKSKKHPDGIVFDLIGKDDLIKGFEDASKGQTISKELEDKLSKEMQKYSNLPGWSDKFEQMWSEIDDYRDQWKDTRKSSEKEDGRKVDDIEDSEITKHINKINEPQSVEEIGKALGLKESEYKASEGKAPRLEFRLLSMQRYGQSVIKVDDKFVTKKMYKKMQASNAIIQAINEIKETSMFKNLFKKKENNMDKDELKSLFMECLSELTASNSKEEEKEEKIEEKIEEKEEKVEDKAENSEDEEKEDEKEDIENKAKNEVVDKRDIIRQIMAIAGKHEDNEDVREIAKLAEKLAYEKSEADKKADNKCKNEEKEEEKEDKKASNSILEGQMAAGKVEFVPVDYNSRKSAIELGNELF